MADANCFLKIICLLLQLVQLTVTAPSGLRCPMPCRCADKGSVMICHRSSLMHIPPLLETAMLLDLDHNHISLLQNGSFLRAPRIEILSLQDNGILHMESGVFWALPELRILRLGRNHLSTLPEDIFTYSRKLQVLDLHANYFSSLPDYAMHNLHSLQILNVSFNHLTSSRLGPGFQYTTQLSDLDLSGNNFASIELNSFQEMHYWDDTTDRHINLSYCNIRHIHPQSLQFIPSLESLSLEGNLHIQQEDLQLALKDLPAQTLRKINLSHMNIVNISEFVRHFQPSGLAVFELAYNRIQRVAKGSFFFFAGLRYLDLSHNEISFIENLAGLSKLEHLNLAFNNLDRLDDMMLEGLHELRVLDMSHNQLVRVDNEPFLNLFNLHTIDVGSNQIQQFSVSDGLESLETLKAGHNKLTNLRFLQSLRRLQVLDLSYNAISRLGDELISRGQTIQLANFSNNAINDIAQHTFQQVTLKILDLSHNRLTGLTNHGWENVRTLYLNDNAIYNLTANVFQNLNSLQELYIERNNLYAFPREIFSDLRQLKVLDLSFNPIGEFLELGDVAGVVGRLEYLETLRLHRTGLRHIPRYLLRNTKSLLNVDFSANQLSNVDSDAFSRVGRLQELNLANNNLASIDPYVFSHTAELQVIDLSSNPFDCNCDMVSLCRFLHSSKPTVSHLRNSTSYRCHKPKELSESSLNEYCADLTQCSHWERVVILAAVGGTMLAVMLVTAVIACRYRSWRRKKPIPPAPVYKHMDETSLTSSTNSSNNSGPPLPVSNLLSKQWV